MLLLVKIKNAGELLWDSLDSQERIIFAYCLASLIVYLASAVSRGRSNDRLVRDVRDELEASRGARS